MFAAGVAALDPAVEINGPIVEVRAFVLQFAIDKQLLSRPRVGNLDYTAFVIDAILGLPKREVVFVAERILGQMTADWG